MAFSVPLGSRTILHRALTQAQQWGLVIRNVAENVKPPRSAPSTRQVWEPHEARTFLASIKGHPLEALFLLALTTGMRRGELLGLRWQDVDEARSQVHIRQNIVTAAGKLTTTTPKSRRSVRAVPIPPDTLAALQAHREAQQATREKAGDNWADLDLIFTNHHGTSVGMNLTRVWYELRDAAGVKRIRFHDLRHTYASVAASRKQVSAQVISERLGHFSVAFTLQTYVHLFDEERRRAVHTTENLFADEAETETPVEAIGVKQG
ncbi:site-specific integrase [Deinococcus cavernae]|uniref:Site-specific integrase n=1 Tax=Deinococcus cavernae TaxID=2320857 RepID=A0A418V011_9DEIO|nr:site-specific integrase [Deinococcus cavernae]RJF69063.1 site-specific integrase [Deinococcus cavernae]